MTQTFRAGQKSKSPKTSSPVQTSLLASRPFPEPVQQKAQQPNLQTILQRAERAGNPISEKPIQKQEESIPNQTGLPDNLKAGVENLSGYSLDNVRVHYNSPKPAQLQALAYTQGTEIHVAPGQEKHLPHEAWHVVQQMQGRVKPTMQMKGVQINDDEGLEREAKVMGKRVIEARYNTHIDPTQKEKETESCNHDNFGTFGLQIKEKQGMITLAQGKFQGVSSKNPWSRNGQKGILQRVKIEGIDIISETDIETIEKALKWSKLLGIIQVSLTPEQKADLLGQLEHREDCEDILDALQEEDQTESEEEAEPNVSDEEKEEKENPYYHFGVEGQVTMYKGVEYMWIGHPYNRWRQTPKSFNMPLFPLSGKGYKMLGVHETENQNVGSLVKNGPSIDKIDTGHHIGKGRGFYVTKVTGELSTATSSIVYGERYVAIYIKESDVVECKSDSPDQDNVSLLDGIYGSDALNYYVMSGGKEIVIPERCFGLVRVAAHPKDINEWE